MTKISNNDSKENNNSDKEEKNQRPIRDVIHRMFDDDGFWNPSEWTSLMPSRWAPFPKVDISENDDEVRVIANIPGIDPDDIDIEVKENTLVLTGKSEKQEEEKNKRYYRLEREYGEFRRSVTLPSRVKAEEVQAKCKNGVLTIVLPKAEEAKRKKIKIEKQE